MEWFMQWGLVKERLDGLIVEAQHQQVFQSAKPQKVSAYILVSCIQPHRLLSTLRRLPGVIKANALINSSEAILVVEEPNMEALNGLLECLERLPGVKLVQPKIAL